MKKILSFIIIFTAAITLAAGLSSCRSRSHNGKLDAQWQVMTIENTNTGEVTAPSDQVKYICIYRDVVNIFHVGIDGNLRYTKGGDTVWMEFPYATSDNDINVLRKLGIYTNPVTFKILKLDGKQLILQSPDAILTCRRF